MARRKKEEPSVHKERIATTAIELFANKGIENTSMDDIARTANYSKATLYVYFQNKEDIVNYITLKSMTELFVTVEKTLSLDNNLKILNEKEFKKCFISLCFALVDFQQTYPSFFESTLNYIEIDADNNSHSILNEIYQVGEKINSLISIFLEVGVNAKILKPIDNMVLTIFQLWGMISGLIKLTSQKSLYIELSSGIKASEFLNQGFEKIYKIIRY